MKSYTSKADMDPSKSSMTDKSRQITLAAAATDIDELQHYDWTFSRANTSYYTHGLHKYPARMPPQIPGTILNFFESQGDIEPGSTVYDPFSGSGTTAVEARLNGHDAIANDINPFACTLTKVKSIPLDDAALEAARSNLFQGLPQTFEAIDNEATPIEELLSVKALDDARVIGNDWFPQPQLYQLLYIREKLNELEDGRHNEGVIRFLRVCLARASRQVSYQRLDEFKRYRMSPEDREKHNPDVQRELRDATNGNFKRMKEYSSKVNHDLETTIFRGDSRHILDSQRAPIGKNDADIVITSPPYGDHQTTVAYGEFSTNLSMIAEGRDFEEMAAVDSRGLGGADSSSVSLKELKTESPSLHDTVESLREIDGRSEDALAFFEDFVQVIEEVAGITKPGQPVAWVVACRRMSDLLIPMHLITRELCEDRGYSFETELPRHIQYKTMPLENPQGKTMADEYIVVMRAPE